MPKISIRVGKIKIIKKMKKLFITLAFVAASMLASAQFYVGGSLGLDFTKDKTKIASTTNDGDKTFSWDITPSIGFMFNDNMGVGLDFGFGMATTTHPETATTPEIKDNTTTWSVAPYFRYVFAEVDNFKFYADAKVGFGGGKLKSTADGQTVDGPKASYLGIGVVPGMAYMLTDNISMNCTLNILALSFEQYKTKVEASDYEATTTSFGFGVNRATPITIGFFYTF